MGDIRERHEHTTPNTRSGSTTQTTTSRRSGGGSPQQGHSRSPQADALAHPPSSPPEPLPQPAGNAPATVAQHVETTPSGDVTLCLNLADESSRSAMLAKILEYHQSLPQYDELGIPQQHEPPNCSTDLNAYVNDLQGRLDDLHDRLTQLDEQYRKLMDELASIDELLKSNKADEMELAPPQVLEKIRVERDRLEVRKAELTLEIEQNKQATQSLEDLEAKTRQLINEVRNDIIYLEKMLALKSEVPDPAQDAVGPDTNFEVQTPKRLPEPLHQTAHAVIAGTEAAVIDPFNFLKDVLVNGGEFMGAAMAAYQSDAAYQDMVRRLQNAHDFVRNITPDQLGDALTRKAKDYWTQGEYGAATGEVLGNLSGLLTGSTWSKAGNLAKEGGESVVRKGADNVARQADDVVDGVAGKSGSSATKTSDASTSGKAGTPDTATGGKGTDGGGKPPKKRDGDGGDGGSGKKLTKADSRKIAGKAAKALLKAAIAFIDSTAKPKQILHEGEVTTWAKGPEGLKAAKVKGGEVTATKASSKASKWSVEATAKATSPKKGVKDAPAVSKTVAGKWVGYSEEGTDGDVYYSTAASQESKHGAKAKKAIEQALQSAADAIENAGTMTMADFKAALDAKLSDVQNTVQNDSALDLLKGIKVNFTNASSATIDEDKGTIVYSGLIGPNAKKFDAKVAKPIIKKGNAVDRVKYAKANGALSGRFTKHDWLEFFTSTTIPENIRISSPTPGARDKQARRDLHSLVKNGEHLAEWPGREVGPKGGSLKHHVLLPIDNETLALLIKERVIAVGRQTEHLWDTSQGKSKVFGKSELLTFLRSPEVRMPSGQDLEGALDRGIKLLSKELEPHGKNKWTFKVETESRELPAKWGADEVRTRYYTNSTDYGDVRDEVRNEGLKSITEALNDMDSAGDDVDEKLDIWMGLCTRSKLVYLKQQANMDKLAEQIDKTTDSSAKQTIWGQACAAGLAYDKSLNPTRSTFESLALLECDHKLAMADHWKASGHNMKWKDRKAWVVKRTNLVAMHKDHNSAKNADSNYSDTPAGVNFDGPAQSKGKGFWWADLGIPFANAPKGLKDD